VKVKAEFPNAHFQLWPGQFVNVRLKVNTLDKATVIPTAAVQRGPAGTFVYVIGDNVVNAKTVTVTQQNETIAVIASGLTVEDRVVTTGFANLSEGARVAISKEADTPTPDLAPRRRQGPGGQGGGDKGQRGEKGERRGQKEQGQKDQGSSPQGGQQGSGTKAPQ